MDEVIRITFTGGRGLGLSVDIDIRSPDWELLDHPGIGEPDGREDVRDGDGSTYFFQGPGVTRWNAQTEVYEHYRVPALVGALNLHMSGMAL
jgi:hypothetical protein